MSEAPETPETPDSEDFLPDLKHVYGIHSGLVGVCAAVLFFVAPAQLGAFICGALLITLNFIFLVGLWRGVLDKKPIARTISIVVIKYAILGAVLYVFVKDFKFQLLPLMAGLSTFVGTFLLVALQTHLLNRSKG